HLQGSLLYSLQAQIGNLSLQVEKVRRNPGCMINIVKTSPLLSAQEALHLWLCVCVCVCSSVCERKRDRERERKKEDQKIFGRSLSLCSAHIYGKKTTSGGDSKHISVTTSPSLYLSLSGSISLSLSLALSLSLSLAPSLSVCMAV